MALSRQTKTEFNKRPWPLFFIHGVAKRFFIRPMLKKSVITMELGSNQPKKKVTSYLLLGFIPVYKSVTIFQG